MKVQHEKDQGLRQRAEQQVYSKASGELQSEPSDDLKCFHELQVHQVELEMQNEQLRWALRELETRNSDLLRAHQLQAHYFDLFDLAPVGYLVCDRNDLIREANLAAAAMLGMLKTALPCYSMAHFILPADLSPYALKRSSVLDTGKLLEWEMRLRHASGTHFWAQLQAIPSHDGNYLIALSDITERKLTEEALLTKEQFFHATIDGLSAHICVIDAGGMIVTTNRSWNTFGTQNSAVPGSFGAGVNYFAACDTSSRDGTLSVATTAAGIRSVLAGDLPEFLVEYACHSPEEQRWFFCRVNPFHISGVCYAVISHENITPRKWAEEHLREINEKYRVVFDNANDGIIICDLQARILAVNPLTEERLGFTNAELTSMTVQQVDALEERELLPERMALLQQQGNLMFETKHQSKDGTLIPTEVNARHIMWDGKPAVLSFCRDITERKLAYQARLTAMGELISAIAHQWRQPLATLAMVVQRTHAIGTMRELTGNNLADFKANAMRQIRYMSDTIDEFRDFYHREKQKVLFSPLSCIHDAARLFEHQFSRSAITVAIHSGNSGDSQVDGFPNEFKQVLLNLLGNARDAILEKRKIGGHPEKGAIEAHLTAGADGSLNIDISDNGCGIADSVAGKIFLPYFTTKKASGGTGIGLYMSRRIVEDSLSGHLSLMPSPEGASFRITLPLQVAP
jgi:PAS domain S-box-containing protein